MTEIKSDQAVRHKTLGNYIQSLPVDVQPIAIELCDIIQSHLPGCEVKIKYGIPAFQLGGRSVIYCAVWKKHIGLYPIYKGTAEFEELVGPFRAKKDTVQLALNKPLPRDLIALIVNSQRSNR